MEIGAEGIRPETDDAGAAAASAAGGRDQPSDVRYWGAVPSGRPDPATFFDPDDRWTDTGKAAEYFGPAEPPGTYEYPPGGTLGTGGTAPATGITDAINPGSGPEPTEPARPDTREERTRAEGDPADRGTFSQTHPPGLPGETI